MVRLVSMMTKQNGIKEFMMVEYLEDVIQSVREFVVAKNLVVSNSLFKKRESHLKTYQSGENKCQIYYILVKQQNFKLVRDVKITPNEECLT